MQRSGHRIAVGAFAAAVVLVSIPLLNCRSESASPIAASPRPARKADEAGAVLDLPRTTPQATVRIMTFNVNWGMSKPESAIEAIQTSGADLVCLQEVQPQWEALIRNRLTAAYPHMIFHHPSHPAGGLAVLSSRPVAAHAVVTPEAGWFPALLIRVRAPIGAVNVLTVHLRPPVSDSGRVTLSALAYSPGIHRQEIEQIIQAVHPEQPLIVCGDFNENDDGAAVAWLVEQGWIDALPRFDAASKTWNWKSGVVYVSGRYDHILFSDDLDCLSCRVLDCDASDHRPVTAVFQAAAPVRPRRHTSED